MYLVCMAPVPVPNGDDFHYQVFLYRSRDAGESWLPALQVPVDTVGEWDHPVIARAPGSEAASDILWVVGTRLTRRSGNGAGIVSYHDAEADFGPFQMYVPSEGANDIVAGAVATSPDRVLLTYYTMSSEPPRPYYVVRRAPSGFERSLLRLDVAPAGFPMLALLPSNGGTPPAIGAVWLEGSLAAGLHAWFARSDDEGRTWSQPVQITEGDPAALRTRPNVAADRNGVIAVTWFESPGGGPCGDVRIRFSHNGGRTFGGDRSFSRGPAPCPADGRLKVIVDRWRGGGDYSGTVSPAPGVFDLVWADFREDGHQVRFARVQVAR